MSNLTLRLMVGSTAIINVVISGARCLDRFSRVRPSLPSRSASASPSRLSLINILDLIVGSTLIISLIIYWNMNESQNNGDRRRNNGDRRQYNGVCRRYKCARCRGKWESDKVYWEDIPPELWGQIGKCIESRFDILHFRSTCQQWRSELPYPERFPIVVPPLPSCAPKFINKTFLITEVNTYLPSKSRLKLLTFEELGNNKFRPTVFHPENACFNDRMISFMVSPNHPFFQLPFVAKAYYLRMAVSRPNPHSRRVEWYLQNYKCAQKTVIISSLVDDVNFSYAKMSDLSVVALMCEEGVLKGRLALLRLGGTPENWHWETEFCSRVFVDIATYGGKLCGLDGWGRVFIMDYHSLQMSQVCGQVSTIAYDLKQKQMFEYSGELYLIDTRRKHVNFKLSLHPQGWIWVKDTDFKVLGAIPFLL